MKTFVEFFNTDKKLEQNKSAILVEDKIEKGLIVDPSCQFDKR